MLPQRTKSKRTRTPNPSKEPREEDHTTPVSPGSSSSTPRTRAGLISRTSSAPLLTRGTEQAQLFLVDEALDEYSHSIASRDSITSIKDDPFFRNYQSPHSISLSRELRSATYSERMREENTAPDEPPPRSAKRPSVDNSVNLPVCQPTSAL